MIPSASGLPRAFRCPGSLTLPKVSRAYSAASHKGTQVHRFLEDVPRVGREKALEAVTDESARLLCEALELERLPLGDGVSWAAEVAFSMDMETGKAREVGRGIGRVYPDDGGLHGTADLVALSADGETAYVLDAKTGHGWLPPAGESEQLRALALMACRAYGATNARIGHLHLREDGGVWTDWAEVEAFDLALFFSALAALLRGKCAATISEGPHCTYCPSYSHCPAKAKLAVSLGTGVAAADLSVALTPEVAAKAWAKLKAARALLHEVEWRLEEYARTNPVALGDGVVLGPVETKRYELDGAGVFRALSKLYGPDVAHEACELEATKKSIDRAMRMVREAKHVEGEKPSLKSLNEAALEAIRKAGALTTKTKVTVKEHRAAVPGDE